MKASPQVQAPAEPACHLVRFEATDGIPLAGVLYEPKRKSNRVAIFLHGTGGSSVFESKRTNVLASEFTRAGIAYFPFNNRGAHVMRRMGDAMGGFSYERIRDCVYDIDGALRELRRRGYRDVTLIGHSTGANKIAVYDHYKKRNSIKRYVLLGGGDDTGLLYEQLGPRRFASALTKARAMIKSRRGEELAPPTISKLPMSWRSFYDMANPDGDYNVFPFLEVMRPIRLSRRPRFRYLRAIRKPALFLYGENDEYCIDGTSDTVAVLAEALGPMPNVEIAILADADHGFGGKEQELASVIVEWMR
ncbi:MAG: alpha/beta fold hydrolase [Acidobacteriota bacterium]|nr:alpha/beta fold hydrolase [Acidobacteriota bacterium]